MAETLPKIKCKKCGHESVKRVEKPIKCPICGTKYDHNEVKK